MAGVGEGRGEGGARRQLAAGAVRMIQTPRNQQTAFLTMKWKLNLR